MNISGAIPMHKVRVQGVGPFPFPLPPVLVPYRSLPDTYWPSLKSVIDCLGKR